MNAPRDGIRIVILGDSIAAGLGVKGACYGDLISEVFIRAGKSVELRNLAHTGFQISDSLLLLPEVKTFAPDFVIIAHGITEAIIRPVPSSMRFIPGRWRQLGWLDPRPFFSRRLWKRIYHQTESSLRWRIKVHLIKTYGGFTLTSADEFQHILSETVEMLLQQTSANIILLTQTGVDERFYPGSLSSLNLYRQCMENIVSGSRTEKVRLCNVTHLLREWSDYFEDHFHPNVAGHAKIAEAIYAILPTKTTESMIITCSN